MLIQFCMRVLTIGFVTFFCAGQLFSQCGTVHTPIDYSRLTIEHNGNDRDGVWIIPVVFHVYFNNTYLKPISPETIVAALDECNLHMRAQGPELGDVHPSFVDLVADCNVELRLAKRDQNGNCISGIMYHNFGNSNPVLVNTYTQNVSKYLNVHVIISQNSYTITPFGSGAGTLQDIIVFSYYDAMLRHEILAHELGHWLGLGHTFGGSNASGISCGDDGIADTPPTKGSVVGTCNHELSECTPGVIENVDNLMDYSNCGKMFTHGQAAVMSAVLNNPDLHRYNHTQDANLEATGVFEEPVCPMEIGTWARTYPGCDSARVELSAWAEGLVPDFTEWYFESGSPSISHQQATDAWYDTPGLKTARLVMCHQGECDTVYKQFTITINDPSSNGMPIMQVQDFYEGFENNFTLPTDHILVQEDDNSTWQVCDFAGYNSSNCLYVPAETISAADTSLLILGNFDLTGLAEPTIKFKVASTYHNQANWYRLHLLCRDLCEVGFGGNLWQIWEQSSLRGDNQEVNFIPTNDAQWQHLSYTATGWNMTPSVEFGLRLIKSPVVPNGIGEAFYLDDIQIGEAAVLSVNTIPLNEIEMSIYPNPADDFITIQPKSIDVIYSFSVTDMTGRTMHTENNLRDKKGLYVGDWPTGLYVISIDTKEGRVNKKLIVR